jgi:hypothetical protein
MNKEKDIFDGNLEKEAPLLHGIPKSNPFIVPDGYFDALPAQIMEACREGNTSTISNAADKIFWLFRPQWMLTAFIAITGLCLFLRSGNNIPANYEAIVTNIPDSVIMQHLQNNIDYVDVSSLEEMSQNPTIMGQQPVQDSTSKEIINYLMNNNVDASDIENEL